MTMRRALRIGLEVVTGFGISVVLGLPLIAFLATVVIEIDTSAKLPYYEAVAQIVPVLIVALVIEARYLSGGNQLTKWLVQPPLTWIPIAVNWMYSVMAFTAVLVSEVVALKVLASGRAGGVDFPLTAGGLAAGLVALVLSVVVFADKSKTGSGKT